MLVDLTTGCTRGGGISNLVAEAQVVKKEEDAKSVPSQPPEVTCKSVNKKKLSYKLQRELDALPGEIEALEEALDELQAQTAEPSFYQGDPSEIQTVLSRLTKLNKLIEQKMERWEELDNMQA